MDDPNRTQPPAQRSKAQKYLDDVLAAESVAERIVAAIATWSVAHPRAALAIGTLALVGGGVLAFKLGGA